MGQVEGVREREGEREGELAVPDVGGPGNRVARDRAVPRRRWEMEDRR